MNYILGTLTNIKKCDEHEKEHSQSYKYTQLKWLEPFIGIDSELKANAKHDFEKALYKLMKQTKFGRSMGNEETHMEYE